MLHSAASLSNPLLLQDANTAQDDNSRVDLQMGEESPWACLLPTKDHGQCSLSQRSPAL